MCDTRGMAQVHIIMISEVCEPAAPVGWNFF